MQLQHQNIQQQQHQPFLNERLIQQVVQIDTLVNNHQQSSFKSNYYYFKSFKSPFNIQNQLNYYQGKIILYHGRKVKLLSKSKIINQKQNTFQDNIQNKITLIIYDQDQKSVYLIQQSISSKKQKLSIQDFKKNPQKITNFLRSWKGYKYTSNKQLSYGNFSYFLKQGNIIQLKIQLIQIQALQALGLQEHTNTKYYVEQFQGNYIHNKRNGISNVAFHFLNQYKTSNSNQPNSLHQFHLNGFVAKSQKIVYKSHYKQGKFLFQIFNYLQKEPKSKKQLQFLNDSFQQIANQQNQQYNFQNNQYPPLISISTSNCTIKSLNQKTWLNPEVVDYFFLRILHYNLSKIQNNNQINMRVMPIRFFGKLIPSGYVGNLSKQINYNQVKDQFQPFKNLVSFFQVYQLVLFPLHRDQNHFSVGAVWTKVQRNPQKNNQIQDFNIEIYQLDSLLHDNFVSLRLISLLQCVFNGQKNEQKYMKGLSQAKKKIKTRQVLKATKQQNHYDCGLYVCLYGLYLYQYICRQRQDRNQYENIKMTKKNEIKWKFDRQKIKLLRKMIKNSILQRDQNLISETKKLFNL